LVIITLREPIKASAYKRCVAIARSALAQVRLGQAPYADSTANRSERLITLA